jgi:hypothetical protein
MFLEKHSQGTLWVKKLLRRTMGSLVVNGSFPQLNDMLGIGID